MRERDVENLASIPRGLGPDPAAQHLDQVFGDGKAQPEPAGFPRASAIHLVEALENAAPVLGRDAGAPVPDAEDDLLVLDLRGDVDGRPGRRELGRVVQEVAKRLRELWAIR